MTYILGISAFYHDSAAALIKDGKIISAAQEERFTRKKHDPSYPFNAIEFVLNYANIKLNDVDQIIFPKNNPNLNQVWFKFGIFLGKIISPVVMGIIFFLVVTPIAFLMKILKKDLLNLKFNKNKSYWIEKTDPKSTMKNQF